MARISKHTGSKYSGTDTAFRPLTESEKADRLALGREIIRDYDKIPSKKQAVRSFPIELTEEELRSRLAITRNIFKNYEEKRARVLASRNSHKPDKQD